MTLRARSFLPVCLALPLLQLAACATVTRTEHADWKVDTLPQGAALSASNGGKCDATPCTLRVSRKERFTATLTKDGYQPMTLDVRPRMTPAGDVAFVGNILIGGVIGMGVDLYTGAALEPLPAGGPFRLTAVGYAGGASGDTWFKPSRLDGKAVASAAECPKEKASYAAFLGVPCASLGAPMRVMTPAVRRR